MRQTQVENMLKDFEDRISALEDSRKLKPMIVEVDNNSIKEIKEIKENIQEKQRKDEAGKESGVTVEKPIPDTPQEKYIPSVESKGLPKTKEGASTARSGDGKSPVGPKVKKDNQETNDNSRASIPKDIEPTKSAKDKALVDNRLKDKK